MPFPLDLNDLVVRRSIFVAERVENRYVQVGSNDVSSACTANFSGEFTTSILPQHLRNSYVVWRHGESEANVAGIIISHPENGKAGFGLTSEGRAQVRKALLLAFNQGLIRSDSLLYCSPFLRCVQTASEIAARLGIREIIMRDELRERNFGELEGKPKQYYQAVYNLDRVHPTHRAFGAESVTEVSSRATHLVSSLEQIHNGRRIVLITHADVGGILQTAFLDLPPNTHRDLPKLKNAEPRELRPMYA